jgi:hypothetical protein
LKKEEFGGKGKLRPYSFPYLLVSLINRKYSGEVILTNGDVNKVVYLFYGKVVYAISNQNEDKLGYLLVKTGKITEKQLEESLPQLGPDKTLGKALLDLGYISSKTLLWTLKLQLGRIVLSLFLWDKGSYSLLEGNLPERMVKLPINSYQLVFDVVRHINDENWLNHHLPDEGEVVSLADRFLDGYKQLMFEKEVDLVITKVDGIRRLRDIYPLVGIPSLKVKQMLVGLLLLDLIKVEREKPG